jgi:hypothetical protein
MKKRPGLESPGVMPFTSIYLRNPGPFSILGTDDLRHARLAVGRGDV